MHLQQRHPATDFFELAQSRAPIQPLADQPRENPSWHSRLFLDGLLNALENIWAKFQPAGPHTGSLEHRRPCEQRKLWDTFSSVRRGYDPLSSKLLAWSWMDAAADRTD
jgi:hypothetical protein